MEQIIDVMLDLETLATTNDCVVISIAAVRFDRKAIYNNKELSICTKPQDILPFVNYIHVFHTPVSLLDCLSHGCIISQGTAQFWNRQKDKSQLVESMAYGESFYTIL